MKTRVLKDLEPLDVFFYFEELSNIPRGSGNEQDISNYLVSFAQKNNLDVIQDAALNVVIKKTASPGYERCPTIIIQGHMDMVCEKDPTIEHDFNQDPIRLQVQDDMIYATGTTLGADNGIAVAMGLALLAARDIPHPPLEVLITTSEETGMDGAHALDPNLLSGRMLINVDSEEEGIFTVSCAGGSTARINFPISWEISDLSLHYVRLSINGLKGGHSGIEIHQGRANANKLLGRVLYRLHNDIPITLCSIDGGSKHNAIAREAIAVIGYQPEDALQLQTIIQGLEKTLRDEYQTSDPDIEIHCIPVTTKPSHSMNRTSSIHVIQFLYLIPNGVQSMSMDIHGLVESSLNLGVIQTQQTHIEMISALRSSVGSIKEHILHTIIAIAKLTNGTVVEEGDYPEWRYNPQSTLREHCSKTYETMFGAKAKVSAIHAGLECAIFVAMFDGKMDMISIGPNMYNVHTTKEHLSISSTKRTWDFLKHVLKSIHEIN